MNIFKTKEEIMNAKISDKLMDRLEYACDDSILIDDSWKWTASEEDAKHYTELEEIANNFDKKELLTICCLTVRKYPQNYLQVLLEYIEEKGKRYEQ